jgi:hypothetical protein
MRNAVTAGIAVAIGCLGPARARADVVEPTQDPAPAEQPPAGPGKPAAAVPPTAVPPTVGPPTVGPPGLTPAVVRDVAPKPVTTSFLIEPLTLAMTTLGVQVEHAITDHPTLAIAGQVGFGVTSKVTMGDRVHTYYHGDTFADLHELSFVRIHAGTQLNLYFERPFRGPHVGVEASYKHFAPTDGDGGNVAVVTGSAYGGWKWITGGGMTFVLQFGASIVGTRQDSEMTGWQRDDEGTLKAAHLFGNFAVGWSI